VSASNKRYRCKSSCLCNFVTLRSRFHVKLFRECIPQLRAVVLNVGEIATPGGDFVIYEFWGQFLRVKSYFKCLIDSKNNIYYFWIKVFDALPTPWFVTKVIKHILDWSRINQTNIVLCNVSLHRLCKTTEIVTGLGVTHYGSHEDYKSTEFLT